jgi:hypothetical protein
MEHPGNSANGRWILGQASKQLKLLFFLQNCFVGTPGDETISRVKKPFSAFTQNWGNREWLSQPQQNGG